MNEKQFDEMMEDIREKGPTAREAESEKEETFTTGDLPERTNPLPHDMDKQPLTQIMKGLVVFLQDREGNEVEIDPSIDEQNKKLSGIFRDFADLISMAKETKSSSEDGGGDNSRSPEKKESEKEAEDMIDNAIDSILD